MAVHRTYLARDTRRQQLVELGLKLFAKRAYEDVSIDEVAREAGMSKGLLYHYFGSKRGFFNEVVRSAADELVAAIEPDPTLSGPANVRRGLLAWFAFVEARADAYLALMSGGIATGEGVGPILESVREQIVARILDGIGAGEVPPTFRVAARSWLGGVEAAACDWLAHRDVTPEQLADVLVASLLGAFFAAQRHAPTARVQVDLEAGFALLRGLFAVVPQAASAPSSAGGQGDGPQGASPAFASDVSPRESGSPPTSGSRGSRRPRPRRSSR